MEYILSLILGYLLGSINTSVIYSRLRGKDIRKEGSGNAGATNTLRTFGKRAAVLVVVFDILKGILAVLVARMFSDVRCEYLAGFAAVLGHNFPIYFGFRGGKGIVTSFAVIVMILPYIALLSLLFGLVVIAITRYVSLGSIMGALAFGVLSIFLSNDLYMQVFSVCIALLAITRHHTNISRLIRGTERKLGK